MTPKQSVAFVAAHGIVVESARSPIPSLAQAVAGGPIRESYWGHPKANEFFHCSRAIRKTDFSRQFAVGDCLTRFKLEERAPDLHVAMDLSPPPQSQYCRGGSRE